MLLVAKTVKVVHNTTHDRQGRSKIGSGKPIIQKVAHHYIGGKISTSSGDIWDVAPNPNQKESDYITILPPTKTEEE